MAGETHRDAVARFNGLPEDQAVGELLACCASRRWAAEVAAGRPYGTWTELMATSAARLKALRWSDVLEALDAHPRIGERAQGATREAAWSRGEQSAAAAGGEGVLAELTEANVEYEDRFGHVFLICATGKTAEQILAAARERFGHDAAVEQRTVRDELAAIVKLRLEKLADSLGDAASAAVAATASAGPAATAQPAAASAASDPIEATR